MKLQYVTPETSSVKVVSEAFVCTSGISALDGERIDYGSPEDLTW